MSFSPYSKMDKSCAWKVPQEVLNKVEFVACEKIHGANFGLLVDRDGVSCARRRGILGDDEDFF